MPLGPGQPPAFLEALGRRSDWEEVVDPGGGDAEAFAACAVEVVELVAALAPRLVGR